MLTIVCATTANYELSKLALDTTQKAFKKAKLLTFSDKPIHPNAEFIKIPKFANAIEYNKFMLSDISKYISTSHFLVVQYDGFVVNKSNWCKSFLNYDYIGAPWTPKSGKHTVGNGGFSLRSLRLQRAIEKEKLRLLENFKNGLAEDRVICDYNKLLLESKYGIRFAPYKVAERFSYEKVKTSKSTFGFHGYWNVPIFFDEKFTFNYLEKFENISRLQKEKLLISSKKMNYKTCINYLST